MWNILTKNLMLRHAQSALGVSLPCSLGHTAKILGRKQLRGCQVSDDLETKPVTAVHLPASNPGSTKVTLCLFSPPARLPGSGRPVRLAGWRRGVPGRGARPQDPGRGPAGWHQRAAAP